jgi:hypothetical protein
MERSDQSAARGLALIEHLLEARCATEIGIAHFALARPTGIGLRHELHQQANLVALRRWTDPVQGCDVGVVHRDQQIEALEVRHSNLTAAQPGKIVAALCRCVLRALVGRSTNVMRSVSFASST